MTALDTDIFSEVTASAPEYLARVRGIPGRERCITIVTAEEMLRGLLDDVRRAEAGRGRRSLEDAYWRLRQLLSVLPRWAILPYSPEAEAQVRAWRIAKVAVGTHDLRIAAICVVTGTTLVTRNRRDFERVPGLDSEFWP